MAFCYVAKWTKIDQLINAVGSSVYKCVAVHNAFIYLFIFFTMLLKI